MSKDYTQRVEAFPIDGGAYNHGAWAVERVTETVDVRRFERIGIIREPMVKTYMEGNKFESTNAYGADRQMHKTWDEALARFS